MKIKNLPLLVGILLPIVFIAVLSLAIYLPTFSIKPQYDFIYSLDTYQYGDYMNTYTDRYVLNDNHIDVQQVDIDTNQTLNQKLRKRNMPTLYVYNVKTNTSHQITLDEAKTYTLDPGPSSPDGYVVKYEYTNNGIFELFGSSQSRDGYFIEKNNAKKQLTGIAFNTSYYQNNFQLLGWMR